MISKRIQQALFAAWLCVAVGSVAAASGEQRTAYGDNPQAGRFARLNGIEMYYETYGSGEPLLLIHGNGQSIAAMHFQIAHFSDSYRVIAADTRGHGKSGLGAGRLTYIQMMEDYNALLEQLGVARADVIGWSDGGIQALLLAIHHPDKVRRMAVMGANLRPDQSAVEAWVPGLLQPLQETIAAMLAAEDTSEDWNRQQQLLDILVTQPDIPVESLRTIQAPVLVLAGDMDIIRAGHSFEIFENLPKAHLAILPGQTHWAPVTAPDVFNALVQKFFTTPFTRPTSEEILRAELNPAGN